MAVPRRSIIGRCARWLSAVLLLPAGVGVSWAVIDLLSTSGRASQFWVPVTAGAGAWFVVFLSLPKPMWLYVVGHELTHALCTWLCGGRVKKFNVNSRGGYVVVSKTNLLITLSPYFFPLYAVLWMFFFWVGDRLFDWHQLRPWFHFGLGGAYAFHVTLTAHILRIRQSDLEGEGWVFSAVIIWLGNALGLLVAVPLLTRTVPLATAFGWALDRTGRFLTGLPRLF